MGFLKWYLLKIRGRYVVKHFVTSNEIKDLIVLLFSLGHQFSGLVMFYYVAKHK